ncbi:MAG: hypothetical protein WC121_03695 [Candidatus Kapaibacterium sp.]
MKRILIFISLLVAATSLAYSLAPVTVVLNNDGDNLTVRFSDYTNGTPIPIDSGGVRTIPTQTPNASGTCSFVVGEGDPDWGNIPPSRVNSYVLIEVFDNGSLVAQFRLDELIQDAAQNEHLPSGVELGGPIVYADGTFYDQYSLANLTSNIMVYTGYGSSIVEADFSSSLVNRSQYTIINSGTGQLDIQLNSRPAPPVTVPVGQTVTLIRLNNNLYFITLPQ